MKLSFNKIAAVAACALAIQNATAIPTLQLDTSNGVFDPATETTVSTTLTFDLQALAQNPSGTYYISAAITPSPANTAAGAASFGSFSIAGNAYSSANMTYGIPPISTVDKELQTHSVFPTWYAEVAFNFNGAPTVAAYNVQDGSSGPGVLSLKTFGIDLTGLTPGFAVHFDLYDLGTLGGGKTGVVDFAPFSHDAEGRPGTSVPDGGATAALLGMGVLGLAAFRRKN